MFTKFQYYNGTTWLDISDTALTHTYIPSETKSFSYDINALECYGIRVYFTCTSNVLGSINTMQVYGTE